MIVLSFINNDMRPWRILCDKFEIERLDQIKKNFFRIITKMCMFISCKYSNLLQIIFLLRCVCS